MYPMCGGFWVRSVNGRSTVCADGSVQDRCYVAELSVSAIGLDPHEEAAVVDAVRGGSALLWGVSQPVTISGFPTAVFTAHKAWVEAKPQASTTTP